MQGDNPYQSPTIAPDQPMVHAPNPRGRIAVSLLAVLLGCVCMLLLNGQTFTNALVFLALATLSLLIWISILASSRRLRRLSIWVIAGHVVIMLFVVVSLPDRHGFQERFNRKMREIRQKARLAPQGDSQVAK